MFCGRFGISEIVLNSQPLRATVNPEKNIPFFFSYTRVSLPFIFELAIEGVV